MINDGFRYQKNKITNDKIHWRCWRKTCNVFLQTAVFDLEENDSDIQILQVAEHNHADETEMITCSSVKQRMLEVVEANPSKPVRRVYDEVIQDAEEDVNLTMCAQDFAESVPPFYPRSHRILMRWSFKMSGPKPGVGWILCLTKTTTGEYLCLAQIGILPTSAGAKWFTSMALLNHARDHTSNLSPSMANIWIGWCHL